MTTAELIRAMDSYPTIPGEAQKFDNFQQVREQVWCVGDCKSGVEAHVYENGAWLPCECCYHCAAQ